MNNVQPSIRCILLNWYHVHHLELLHANIPWWWKWKIPQRFKQLQSKKFSSDLD